MRKPASRDIISASVELCETDVCFLHIQLFGTNVWFPKMHKSPPDADLSLQGPLQNENLETVPVCIVWQCFPHDNIVCIHLCDEFKRSNAQNVCHKLQSML